MLIIVSCLSYFMYSDDTNFQWSFLNPMEALEGIVFTLSFGLGLPAWLSIILVIGLLIIAWRLLFRLYKRIFLKTESDNQ